MPLLPTTLAKGLMELDEPTPPSDPASTALKWFEAWWAYASGMSYLNPATTEAARNLVQGPFVGILTPACVPNPVPGVFFLGLEGAMRVSWLALGTPATLLPTVLSIIPAPVPFAPMGLAVVPVGLASPSKHPPRLMLATTLHAWTLTHTLATPSGTPVPML